MVVKEGRYGKFLACPGYPKCKNILPLDGKKKVDETPEELPPCPECGKPLKKILFRGSSFYGCTGYPACKFTSRDKPIAEKCPRCGSYMTEHRTRTGTVRRCGNKECGYTENADA